ncbi:GNAT family N-acetyltransferase [Paenibacillus nanensis]|uniref:GNAT family N-acetyltransferase n=1 Tax=Paenibacillus nanensis TaxID=393251 RepID=A0A3A1UY10_9BACL|nr:GNAT family N-acetyltransferase [Paenibacillus nanensis]RIX50210.1 GNAT family N-acetyltransferase [Paenibacillus nanensis]
MNITFKTIKQSDSNVLHHLYNYYLYELSAYSMEDVTPEGKYIIEDISPYYLDPRLYPYLIMADKMIAGFILVTSPPYVSSGIDYSIQEMFILPKYRGKGVAREAALHIFKQHQGHYEIGMFQHNVKAVTFWSKLLSSLNIKAITETGDVRIAGNQLPTKSLRFFISGETIQSHVSNEIV